MIKTTQHLQVSTSNVAHNDVRCPIYVWVWSGSGNRLKCPKQEKVLICTIQAYFEGHILL